MRKLIGVAVWLVACSETKVDPKPAPATDAAPPAVTSAASPPTASTADAGAGLTLPDAIDGILEANKADAVVALGKPPVVRVLDAGREPRRALRYAFAEGTKQVVDMRMGLELEVRGVGAGEPKQAVPDVVFRLELTAKEKTAAGESKIEGSIVKVSVEPKGDSERALAARFEPTLRGLHGMRFSYVCSPDGRLHDVETAAGSKTDVNTLQMLEQLKQSFDSIVAPLPSEPLGEGARWQALSRVRAGADVLQLTTFTLAHLKGNEMELTSVLDQVAATRTITMSGVTGTLKEFKSSGKSAMTSDLTKLAPSRLQGGLDGHVVSNVPGVGSMTVDTKLDLQFVPVAP